MNKALVDKIDELYVEDDFELFEEELYDLDKVDGLFAKGTTVSAEDVARVEALWEKYCGGS